MNRTRRGFLGLAGVLALVPLAGCASFGSSAPVTFDLASSPVQGIRRKSSTTVVITEPKAVQTYDSARIVVREAGGVLSYLPEAQWSDRLPALVQTRMLQTFEQAGFPNIGRPDDQLAVDVTLAVEILAFELDVSSGPLASVSLAAKLVDERRGSVSRTRVMSARVPVTATDGIPVVSGLDAALRDVNAQILAWAAEHA